MVGRAPASQHAQCYGRDCRRPHAAMGRALYVLSRVGVGFAPPGRPHALLRAREPHAVDPYHPPPLTVATAPPTQAFASRMLHAARVAARATAGPARRHMSGGGSAEEVFESKVRACACWPPPSQETCARDLTVGASRWRAILRARARFITTARCVCNHAGAVVQDHHDRIGGGDCAVQ